MWALVPLKSPVAAKSRLRPVLPDAQRRDLFFLMAGQVLGALSSAAGIDKLIVVTPSAEVGRFAESFGARVLLQARECGTAQALLDALECLHPPLDEALLMMSGDLPLISGESLLPLLSLAGTAGAVGIVPDRSGRGTNALLCAPSARVPICFGPDSFQRHVDGALERGIQPQSIESDALCLDIDTPEDLDRLYHRLQERPEEVPAALRQWFSLWTHRAGACAA